MRKKKKRENPLLVSKHVPEWHRSFVKAKKSVVQKSLNSKSILPIYCRLSFKAEIPLTVTSTQKKEVRAKWRIQR